MARKENPNQLRLFMTPKEIMSAYKPNAADKEEIFDDDGDWREETDEELWNRKADEAVMSGLTDDIIQRGVHIPVSLDIEAKRVRGGHHRIAAMNHINPKQFLPVNYAGSVSEAHRDERMYINGSPVDDIRHDDWMD